MYLWKCFQDIFVLLNPILLENVWKPFILHQISTEQMIWVNTKYLHLYVEFYAPY